MARPFPVPQAPPLEFQRGETFAELVAIMRRLLAPDGCPWDRAQSFQTLKKYVLEEACEVIDAIDSGSFEALREELGDLALQIAFLSELGRSESAFGPDDVFVGIVEKLERRHPHVFADGDAQDPEQVEKNWEAIKAKEKAERPLLDHIPRSLPALHGAARVSEQVSRVGFDWPDAAGSWAKVSEELAELDQASQSDDPSAVEHELGDLLFALVNYGRHLGVDAEAALRRTNDRFRRRFAHVERRVKERHGDWPRDGRGKAGRGIGLDELDGYWTEAKELES